MKKVNTRTDQQREEARVYMCKWRASHPGYADKMSKRWYAENSEYAGRIHKKWIKDNNVHWKILQRGVVEKRRLFIVGIKKEGRCVMCFNSDFRVLEFAHKKHGIKNISISYAFSLKKIKAELKLCILLCANCHTRRDHKEARRLFMLKRTKRWWDTGAVQVRATIRKIKTAGSCTICKENDSRILEFAHKRHHTKEKAVSSIRSMRVLLVELKKCVLLCANCHKIKDYRESQRRHRAQRKPIMGEQDFLKVLGKKTRSTL